MILTKHEQNKILREREKKQNNSLFNKVAFKRFNKLNKLKNNHNNFIESLESVMTFKECEIVYQLPKNQCHQDHKNGKIRQKHYRKSADKFIITVQEAERLYKNYWTQRAKKNNAHLYLSLDGQKMSENEFEIRFGNYYNYIETEQS